VFSARLRFCRRLDAALGGMVNAVVPASQRWSIHRLDGGRKIFHRERVSRFVLNQVTRMAGNGIRAQMERAIHLFGSEKKLGNAIGYSQHAVWHAKKTGRVSPRMAVEIERATRGAVTRIGLCPEVFAPIKFRAA
jgi:DNA-binding transcriptional regulator YdaS (Cro superfamily)